ncbi:MAG: hypothetical protein ACRC0Y_13935 [Fusobacteriaceae bacterium]
MQKIKLVKTCTTSDGLKGLTIQMDPALYKKLSKISKELDITKRVIINTALIKLLDDIEKYGVQL